MIKISRFKNIIIFVILSYILLSIFDRLYILYQIDKTLEKSYYFDQTVEKKQSLPPVYLVSYAGRKSVFFKNQNAQAMSAINNGIDHIMMYKRRDIDEIFYKENKRILDTPSGDGLWLWKPYFILKTMQNAPENSLIIFADSPVIFKKPITHFIKIMQHHNVLILLDGSIRKKTIRSAGEAIEQKFLTQFNIDYTKFAKTTNISACFMIVKNNEASRTFIKQWINNCQQARLDTPCFEQSMLVLAAFQMPQQVCSITYDISTQYIKNVHRHPHEEYKSMLPDLASRKVRWFKVSEWFYNSRLMIWLRKTFKD